MEDNIKDSFEKAAAFQSMWMDTFSGMARVWGQYSPENPSPDELKKVRQGMLRVVSQSWDEFMRTPQFMEMMRDSINNSMQWQGAASEGVERVHSVMQTPTKKDIDGVLLAIRHVEKRVLDHLEIVHDSIEGVQSKMGQSSENGHDKAKDAFRSDVVARLKEIEASLSALQKAKTPARPVAKKAATKKTVAKKRAPEK